MPTVADPLTTTFAALADPTRRAILGRLAEGEATVNQLAAPFPITTQAVSQHLKVLERAGLISHGRDAQRRPRKLEAAPLAGPNREARAASGFTVPGLTPGRDRPDVDAARSVVPEQVLNLRIERDRDLV